VAQTTELDRDLQVLESELRKLEGEYNMYFAGRLPRPPWETRSRVDVLVKRLDRSYIQNYGDRFRFSTLQSRFAAFIDLWDRGLRAREEGRPGPFGKHQAEAGKASARPEDRIVHVAAFREPMKEMDKVHELYNRVVDTRRELGLDAIPFHKFTQLIKDQVAHLRESGAPEVAFRVAVKDGKVSFTARGLKGAKTKE
jgi:hypothetical protein